MPTGTFEPGDSVRIVRNVHSEDDSQSFIGQTGTISAVTPSGVTVAGLDGPDSPQTHWARHPWFLYDEIEKA